MLSTALDAELSELAGVRAAREAVGYRASCAAMKPLADLLAHTYGIGAQRPLGRALAAADLPVPTPAAWQTIGRALQLVQDRHHDAWLRAHPQYAQATEALGGAQPGLLHRVCTVYLPAASWVQHWPSGDGGEQLDGRTGRGITALRASHPTLDPALAQAVADAVDALPLAPGPDA